MTTDPHAALARLVCFAQLGDTTSDGARWALEEAVWLLHESDYGHVLDNGDYHPPTRGDSRRPIGLPYVWEDPDGSEAA